MINFRLIFFSVILVLFVWGFGWLIYEFGGLYSIIRVEAWQNIMLVVVGVCLCCVMILAMKPEKNHEESIVVHEESPKRKPRKQPKKKSGKALREEIKKLGEELLNTKPNSKKRRELMQKMMELEGKPKK